MYQAARPAAGVRGLKGGARVATTARRARRRPGGEVQRVAPGARDAWYPCGPPRCGRGCPATNSALTIAPARADTGPGVLPMASRARLGLIAGLGLLLAPNHDAAARKLQMSGTWVIRYGQIFLPLQFAAAGMFGMGFT